MNELTRGISWRKQRFLKEDLAFEWYSESSDSATSYHEVRTEAISRGYTDLITYKSHSHVRPYADISQRE